MFARLSAAVLLALPLLAAAGESGGCSTGTQVCCNSVQDAKSAGVANLLFNVLGVAASGVTGQVGAPSLPLASLAIPATNRPFAATTTTS
ncbi:hypothetical protein H0H92_002097, partial [Tricholoma furcatifolium]